MMENTRWTSGILYMAVILACAILIPVMAGLIRQEYRWFDSARAAHASVYERPDGMCAKNGTRRTDSPAVRIRKEDGKWEW